MKLKEILELAKTKKKQTYPDLGILAEEAFELYNFNYDKYYNKENIERLSYIPIEYWLCTDTEVGYNILFFDDKIVAVTVQKGRKCDVNYYWVSEEAYHEVFSYVKTFERINDAVIPLLTKEALEEEWDEYYNLDFASQFLNSHVTYYNNKRVYISNKRIPEKENEYTASTQIYISYKENLKNSFIVNVEDIKIKILT